MNRLAWLALTGGWATTCVLLWIFGHPGCATFAFLSALACPRGDDRDPGVGTSILGVALGLMSSLALIESGNVAVGGSIAVTLASGGWIAWSGRSTPTRWSVQDLSLSLILAGAAVAATVQAFSVPAAQLSGLDLGTLIYASAPLLLLCAMTAGAAQHLSNRHRTLAPYLGAALALGIVLLALVAGDDLGDAEARASQIHGPNVSRAQFLFGASLLAWLLGMKAAALAGACAGLRKPRSLGGGTISVVIGAAIAAMLAPPGLGIVAGTALGSIAFAATSKSSRVTLGILGVGLAWAVKDGPDTAQPILEDRVRTWLGPSGSQPADDDRPNAEPNPPAIGKAAIDGRLVEPLSPPGWPVGNDDLANALAYIAHRTGGHNELLGPETSARPTPEHIPITNESGEAHRNCLTLLPGVFALPLRGLILNLGTVARGNDEAPVRAAIIDLRELSMRDLSTVARALRDGGRPPDLAIAGCLAILIGGADPDRSNPQPSTSPTSHPADKPVTAVPLLSAPAVSQLAEHWPPKNEAALLDREARWRRTSRRPKFGAHNLRTLLARSDQLPHSDNPDDPAVRHAFSARVRLALCAAILDDDAVEEGRLLRVLSRLGASDVDSLREKRDEAHEALLQFAIDARNQDPSDAEARYRLGAILRGRGSPLAAIDEMTTAIDRLRPLMTECYTELAEAYVDAERQAERRVVKNPKKPLLHILDGVRMVPGLQQAASRHHQGQWPAWLRCRAETSRGEASLMRAQREDETDLDRRDLLMNAAGRFQAALETDPMHAPALRGLAQCLSLLRMGNPGRHAREAVLADPLNPEGHTLLARLTPRVQERRQAISTWILLR